MTRQQWAPEDRLARIPDWAWDGFVEATGQRRRIDPVLARTGGAGR